MLTDEERKLIDALTSKPERPRWGQTKRLIECIVRLDAELAAFKAYMELEHAKLHEEHRDRMAAESAAQNYQEKLCDKEGELSAARAEGERLRELMRRAVGLFAGGMECGEQWTDRCTSMLKEVQDSLRPQKEPAHEA